MNKTTNYVDNLDNWDLHFDDLDQDYWENELGGPDDKVLEKRYEDFIENYCLENPDSTLNETNSTPTIEFDYSSHISSESKKRAIAFYILRQRKILEWIIASKYVTQLNNTNIEKINKQCVAPKQKPLGTWVPKYFMPFSQQGIRQGEPIYLEEALYEEGIYEGRYIGEYAITKIQDNNLIFNTSGFMFWEKEYLF